MKVTHPGSPLAKQRRIKPGFMSRGFLRNLPLCYKKVLHGIDIMFTEKKLQVHLAVETKKTFIVKTFGFPSLAYLKIDI